MEWRCGRGITTGAARLILPKNPASCYLLTPFHHLSGDLDTLATRAAVTMRFRGT